MLKQGLNDLEFLKEYLPPLDKLLHKRPCSSKIPGILSDLDV